MKSHCTMAAMPLTVPVFGSCAIMAAPVASIGPARDNPPSMGPNGYLEVYTTTRYMYSEYPLTFHLHAGCDVKRRLGKAVPDGDNHASGIDEGKERVALEPGSYLGVARSTWRSLIRVPMVAEQGDVTAAHQKGDKWSPEPGHRPSAAYIFPRARPPTGNAPHPGRRLGFDPRQAAENLRPAASE